MPLISRRRRSNLASAKTRGSAHLTDAASATISISPPDSADAFALTSYAFCVGLARNYGDWERHGPHLFADQGLAPAGAARQVAAALCGDSVRAPDKARDQAQECRRPSALTVDASVGWQLGISPMALRVNMSPTRLRSPAWRRTYRDRVMA